MNTHWDRAALHHFVTTNLRGRKLIVVSNREPYIHNREGSFGSVTCMRPASGMATALDPILRASGGVWVAHGSGNADRETVDALDHINVPPEAPAYTLRRVWLDKTLEREYYYGTANRALWPLCHIVFQRPRFSHSEWNSYRRANEVFASAVLEEAAGHDALVFIQDYHFGLLARMLKRANPRLTVAQFWHIPWPNRETFRSLPWREELLDGLLGNDLLGFHLQYHCTNFLDTVDRHIEACVDAEHGLIHRGGHSTRIRPFPISIDFDDYSTRARSRESLERDALWVNRIGYRPDLLGVGVDRIDYTKGISERLQAIDLLLREHPEYVGRLTFVQIAVPSRTTIAEYDRLNSELAQEVDSINSVWRRGAWTPIVMLREQISQEELIALHLMADFCVVSSLHDGMNLVAKEFIASRVDCDGVLILSQFTGAARELNDALQVNPFAISEITAAIERALSMNAAERSRRMRRMREIVAANNVFRWGGSILESMLTTDVLNQEQAPRHSVQVERAGAA